MNDIDLDLNHYDLDDLLQLFKIKSSYTESDLKQCRKTVMKMHPDKSNLPSEYFIFFSKAYNVLAEIYKFKYNLNRTDIIDYKMIIDDNEIQERQALVKKLTESDDFLKHFNKAFEQTIKPSDYSTKGYEDWLKNSDDIVIDKNNKNINATIETYKQQQITIKHDLQDICENDSSNIEESAPENYSSNIFSKLAFEDIKSAHETGLINVSQNDYKRDYHTIKQLKIARDSNIIIPTKEQSNQMLNERLSKEQEISTSRAYRLARQSEISNDTKQNFDKYFLKLNYNININDR